MTVHLKRWSACLGALVLLGLLGLPGRASAVVIYHSGEDAFPVVDMTDDILDLLAAELQVPDEDKAQFKQDFAGQKIGYQCDIFGLFWAYFAWWNCEPILLKFVDSNTFEFLPLEPEKVADPNQRILSQAIVKVLEQKAGGKKFAEAYPPLRHADGPVDPAWPLGVRAARARARRGGGPAQARLRPGRGLPHLELRGRPPPGAPGLSP